MTHPNQSPELERLILMSLMHLGDPNEVKVQQAMLKLTADCFYDYLYGQLFGIIRECFQKGEMFTIVDVLMLIKKDDNDLFEAYNWVRQEYSEIFTGTANFLSYVDRLIALKVLRKQMSLMAEAQREVSAIANPESAQESLLEHINLINNLSFRASKDGISAMELTEAYFEGLLPDDVILPTTCDQLNELLGGGIRAKSLITIAAGAGVGKTGFAIFLMDAIARNQPDTHSLFFSIEMEARHIWQRHMGICAGKQFDDLTEQEKLAAVPKLASVPVRIYDLATCRNADDIDFILTTARLKAMEKPISVIVVDYLGLVENRGRFERNDLKQSDTVTKLSKLAIELNCVVICLSQINRANAARSIDDRCPWPHDAADSSGSHRSSALWLGVDRPDQYQDDPCYRNQFVIKCRKNRFGGIFELILAFNEGTFAEVPEGWFRQPSKPTKNIEQALFSGRGKDFSEKQYVD